MNAQTATAKYDGRYFETPTEELDIENPTNPTDAQVKVAMAAYIEQESGSAPNLADYVVDPPEAERMAGQHENITVLNLRPSATFG